MEIDRRQFVGTLAACLALSPARARASDNERPIFLSTAKKGRRHKAVLLDDDGTVHWSLDLPGRGHGGAFRNGHAECIVFARRPGAFALVINHTTGRLVQTLTPPQDRHFYGHGCYSADGRRLYTTENDFNGERGVIGLWDAADGYRRIGEFDSYGTGPHEAILLAGGHTLAIANGGILTHPDTGRHKLNIADMEPSLVLVDGNDGSLLAKHEPPRALHKLSLRHVSANSLGGLFAAAQYEGSPDDAPPLLASLQSGQLTFHTAPREVQRSMRNYCGAVSFDTPGEVLAVSCPRGNLITFWTPAGAFLSAIAFKDGCALAPTPRSGEFLAAAGTRRMLRCAPHNQHSIFQDPAAEFRWDNHMSAQRPFPI